MKQANPDQGHQNRNRIRTVSSELVGDESPERRAADSDESDQSGDKGSHQLVKTERHQVCHNVCSDHEDRGSQCEMADCDAPEWKRSDRST